MHRHFKVVSRYREILKSKKENIPNVHTHYLELANGGVAQLGSTCFDKGSESNPYLHHIFTGSDKMITKETKELSEDSKVMMEIGGIPPEHKKAAQEQRTLCTIKRLNLRELPLLVN